MSEYIYDRLNMRLIGSDNPITQYFVDTCKGLNVRTYAKEQDGCKFACTQALNGEDGYTLLEVLRDEGFDVTLVQYLFYPDRWTVVLKGDIHPITKLL